jgi:hypothetical protein
MRKVRVRAAVFLNDALIGDFAHERPCPGCWQFDHLLAIGGNE